MGDLRQRVTMSDVVREFTRGRRPARIPVALVHEIRRRVIIEGEKPAAVASCLTLSVATIHSIARGRRRADIPPDDALRGWLAAQPTLPRTSKV